MSKKSFAQIFAEARQSDSFWAEGVILEFTRDLERLMERKGISYSELADILGTSKAYITKVFRGNANFTLQTMVKLSRALGGNLHVHVVEQTAKVRWVDIYDGKMKTIKKSVELVDIQEPKENTVSWVVAQGMLKQYRVQAHAEAQ